MEVTDKIVAPPELCVAKKARCIPQNCKTNNKDMFNLFSPQTKAYKNLNGKEFKDTYQNAKKAVLLDVRTAAEFSSGSIKGSRNLDIMSPLFIESIASLDKNSEYFVFCRSGNRSAQACSIMAKQDLKVCNLADGIGAWPF